MGRGPRDLATHIDRNTLLAALDDSALTAIGDGLEPVTLPTRAVLAEPGERLSHIYFVCEGIISRVGLTSERRTLELACTGREGAAGVLDVIGSHSSPYRLIVQFGCLCPLPHGAAAARTMAAHGGATGARFEHPAVTRVDHRDGRRDAIGRLEGRVGAARRRRDRLHPACCRRMRCARAARCLLRVCRRGRSRHPPVRAAAPPPRRARATAIAPASPPAAISRVPTVEVLAFQLGDKPIGA